MNVKDLQAQDRINRHSLSERLIIKDRLLQLELDLDKLSSIRITTLEVQVNKILSLIAKLTFRLEEISKEKE